MCKQSEALIYVVPGSLVVRIRRSHRRGRGSIPRQGDFLRYSTTNISGARDWWIARRWKPDGRGRTRGGSTIDRDEWSDCDT